MITKAEFESSATGQEIYRVEGVRDFKALEEELAACPYHVIVKVDSAETDAIRFLASQGFCYNSTILHLKRDLQDVICAENKKIQKLSLAHQDQLFKICDEAFCHNQNRYTDDPLLRNFCAQIHRAWILNSLNGFADYNIGYFEQESLAGFGTLHFKEECAIIGLIATEQSYRGKGIGTHVVQGLIAYAIQNQKKILIVKTQATNVFALNLYGRNGFFLFGSEVTLYRERRNVLAP